MTFGRTMTLAVFDTDEVFVCGECGHRDHGLMGMGSSPIRGQPIETGPHCKNCHHTLTRDECVPSENE